MTLATFTMPDTGNKRPRRRWTDRSAPSHRRTHRPVGSYNHSRRRARTSRHNRRERLAEVITQLAFAG